MLERLEASDRLFQRGVAVDGFPWDPSEDSKGCPQGLGNTKPIAEFPSWLTR